MNLLKITALVATLLLGACSRKEGCRDLNGLNYDPDAEKDGRCRYTKAIFYAPGDRVGGNGNRIVRIEISLGPVPNEELIGEITVLNQDSPSGCSAPQGALDYELPGGDVDYIFLTRYYYEDNTSESGETYTLRASSAQECENISLTL